MTDFKLPDPKKTSGRVVGALVLGAIGLLTYAKILPWLNSVVWGTVELAIGVASAAFLVWILTSKKFWKRCRIILEGLGQLAFGWMVEMNKWAIMENQLNSIEEDRTGIMEANKRLQGQEVSLQVQLHENNQLMKQSAEEVEICRRKLAANPNDEETALQLESSTVTFNNAKDFVDEITPLHHDIRTLVEQTEKAYRKSENMLKNARKTLQMQRSKYDALAAGSSAMTKALRAFQGDSEMNNAAAIARRKIEKDIANMAGTIRTTIKATSSLMNERDLKDAAKVSLAARTIQQLNADDKFEYTPSAELLTSGTHIPKVAENKYLDYLK